MADPSTPSGRAAMVAASEAAAAALGAEMSPGELEAAKERAARIVQDSGGMGDLRRLLYTMGLPAARALLKQLVAANGHPPGAAAELCRLSEAISPVQETGCMQLDFFNRLTGAPDRAYLVLEECPRDHDLGAQLDRLRVHVADSRWPEIQKHLSAIVLLARSMYSQAAQENLPLLRRILKKGDADPCADWLTVRVDPANTTLYVADGPRRVGIFVYFASEVPAPGL